MNIIKKKFIQNVILIMKKTRTIKDSISYLNQGTKIYKRPSMYQITDMILDAERYSLIDIKELQENIKQCRDLIRINDVMELDEIFECDTLKDEIKEII